MRDGRSGAGEARELVGVEMHAVGQPGPPVQPAAFLQIIERPALVDFQAIAVLVLGFGEMRVHAHIEPLRQFCGRAHERGGHRKW